MRPLVAGILPADDDALPGEAHRPDFRRAHVGDIQLDGSGRGSEEQVEWACRLRQDVEDARIAFDARNVGPGR